MHRVVMTTFILAGLAVESAATPRRAETCVESWSPIAALEWVKARSGGKGGCANVNQAPSQPMRVGGAIRMPAKTRDVPPTYPPIAIAARVEGLVIVSATLSTEGKVIDATIVRSVPLIDAAALQAVRQWEFAPTIYNGAAVPLIVTITLDFSLDDVSGADRSATTIGGTIQDVDVTAGTVRLRESAARFVYGPETRLDPFSGPSVRLAGLVQPPPFKAGQLVWVKSRPTADPSTRRILAIAVLGPSTFEAATPPGAALPVERVASPVTVKIEEAEYCCPDYVQLIVSAIQQTWQSNQGAAGTVTLRFRIARSGTIEDIQVVRPSGFAILDVAARRALQLARLPPLPTAFPKDSLMVSLDFQYAPASSTGPASPPPAR